MVEYIVAIDVTRVRFPADAFALEPWLPRDKCDQASTSKTRTLGSSRQKVIKRLRLKLRGRELNPGLPRDGRKY